MEYRGEGFLITISDTAIMLSGKIETNVYTEILDFLKHGEQTLQAEPVILDVRQLTYLNSAGIKMLAVFMTGSPKTFEVHVDTHINWQQHIMLTLRYIKPDGITIIAAAQ